LSLIAVDRDICTRCGACARLMKGYCITQDGGYPVFDKTLCNTCQKCVAICPAGAITVNGVHPDRIEAPLPDLDLERLLERRRSTKRFENRPLSRDILERIVGAARYAPNQNKNIAILVLDDQELIRLVDRHAISYVRRIRALLFGCRPLAALSCRLSGSLRTIRRKMDLDLEVRRRVVKEGTQALVILTGKRSVPVTEHSAHYVLATVMYMAQSLGVDSCLMDSLVLALNSGRGFRKTLGLRGSVLGVLALGHSAEGVVNIPRGYEVPVRWNVLGP
jgi:nitroreductase/NAD-dependent dihydropyrimidine dehydrogenase PreA subunit